MDIWLNTAVGIAGMIVGIIGIVVGIIGGKSLKSAIDIKNIIKAGNVENVQQAKTIYNGLSPLEVIETAQKEVKTILSEKEAEENCLIVKCILIGAVLFNAEKECVHSIPGVKNGIGKLKIWHERNDEFYPNIIKCSFTDPYGEIIPIVARKTTMEIFPTKILNAFNASYMNGSDLSGEVSVSSDQTIVGRIAEDSVMCTSFYKKAGDRFHFRTIVYGPKEENV